MSALSKSRHEADTAPCPLSAISDIDDGTGVAVVERCRAVCDVDRMIRVLSQTSR
jgi:hypothetical protein